MRNNQCELLGVSGRVAERNHGQTAHFGRQMEPNIVCTPNAIANLALEEQLLKNIPKFAKFTGVFCA